MTGSCAGIPFTAVVSISPSLLKQSLWPFFNIPGPKGLFSQPHAHPSSFNSPHYLRLQISLSLARVTAALSHREREKERQRGDGRRKEKEVQARRGRDEFHRRATRLYAFLKGRASCSFSSPPPPKLTHHTARTHASHTLKHALLLLLLLLLLPQWCPLFLQHAPYRTGSGDFFLSASSLLFSPRKPLPASTSVFPLTGRAVFHFTWTIGNKMFLISRVSSLLLAVLLHVHVSL